MRYADHRALGHAGVGIERGLDLGRIDVLAARDDHVLEAVDDVEDADLVHVAEVAGVQPAIAQRLRGQLGLVPVAFHHQRPAHDDLAVLSWRQKAVLGVDDGQLAADQRPAYRIGFAEVPVLGPGVERWQRGHAGGRFGHAVAGHEACLGEVFLRFDHQRLGHRRGAVEKGFHAGQVEFAGSGLVDHHAQHRRHATRHGHAVALDGSQRLEAIEARQHHGAAQRDQRRYAQPCGTDVEHRCRDHRHRVVVEPDLRCKSHRAGHQVGVGVHHTLGRAGAATGVEQAYHIVAAAAEVFDGIRTRQQVLVALRASRGFTLADVHDMLHRRSSEDVL